MLSINHIKIRESQKVDLLCLTIDNWLKKYLTPEKAKLLYIGFINSQFSCAAVIWMLCRKKNTVEIKKN